MSRLRLNWLILRSRLLYSTSPRYPSRYGPSGNTCQSHAHLKSSRISLSQSSSLVHILCISRDTLESLNKVLASSLEGTITARTSSMAVIYSSSYLSRSYTVSSRVQVPNKNKTYVNTMSHTLTGMHSHVPHAQYRALIPARNVLVTSHYLYSHENATVHGQGT